MTDKLLKLYDELAASFPKSTAIQRIPLDFCSQSEFTVRADKFIRNSLRRGVPCLFTVLKPLYKARADLAPLTVEEVVTKRLQELAADGKDGETEKGYALYLLAQHQDQLNPGCEVSRSSNRRSSKKAATRRRTLIDM